VDYNTGEKHQLAVHDIRDSFFQLQNTAALITYDRQIPRANASVKWTWVASPTMVTTFRVTATDNVNRQVSFSPIPSSSMI
jgi:hypothetical protein